MQEEILLHCSVRKNKNIRVFCDQSNKHTYGEKVDNHTSRLLSRVSLLQNLFLLPTCWYLTWDGKIEHAHIENSFFYSP
jgi:hypothetical protein